MSKTVKIILLAVTLLAVVGGAVYYLTRKKSLANKTASAAATSGAGTSAAVGTGQAASVQPVASQVAASPFVRPVYPASGDVAALVAKSGKSQDEILKFLTWDSAVNGRPNVPDWVAGMFANDIPQFTVRYLQYAAVNDADYLAAYQKGTNTITVPVEKIGG